MPSKRRNNGRGKKNKGHSNVINCTNCGRVFPKDKAIKRFQMKKIVDESSRKDLEDNFAYDKQDFYLPKLYMKQTYCVSCAIHARVVRVRSQIRGDRDIRYTTKIRGTNNIESRTGGFAVPAPNLLKALNRASNRPQNK
uniref:40S ribosomal protein S26 n=1 Tax=Strombidium rassoulzadegani TaxID=1082188 RepID=A0A7S3CRN0_9SPIT|mmetsp:Transcript_5590/g.9609  ORF Transcript_5590/g.9609 Transcript_5590/m.9609 type:complete len:139 (+) Transcript_5590:45-461(+)